MKKIIKAICLTLALISGFSLGTVCYYNNILPDNIMIYENETVSFNTKLEIVSKKENIDVNASGDTLPSKNYNSDLSLLGIIPIKSVNINKVKERYVVLSGESFGIKIFTKGVMIVGMSDVDTKNGNANPAKKAGLKIGDIILKVNDKKVNSNEELSDIINSITDKQLNFTVKREDRVFTVKFSPVYSRESDCYKAGLWVRDSTAGLGTMTFYSSVDGAFAGLGHAIVDVDTGIVLPINSGEIVKTQILSVTKSKSGSAGEICGAFTSEVEGRLLKNSDCGLYGVYNSFDKNKKLIKIAHCQSVKTGKAKIYTTVDNTGPKYYDCVVERVLYNDDEYKNILIRITDDELIEKCGGIVQGMSGSPIIQNGELVGALTNVFVNNPEKGYAIFSEKMYENMIDISENSISNRVS